MKTMTIHELLNDIEMLNNYLHRYVSRAATTRAALGLPGVRILSRVLGYVKQVRKEITELESIQNGMRPLMAAEDEIESLKAQLAASQQDNATLRQQLDRQALNAESYKKASTKAKSELNTLTTKYNQLKAEQVCH
jgi:chromosome segregation ATPase